jgi:hypothetical protein
MSLILDALRKLEHEKGAQEPGVLVVGSVPWGETSRGRRLALRGGALLVVALAVLVGWLLRRSPAAPTPSARPGAAVAPTAAPIPSVPPVARATAPPATFVQPAEPPPPIRLSHASAAAPVHERAAERPAAAAPSPAAPASEPAVSAPAANESSEPARTPAPHAAAPASAPAPPGAAPDDLRLTAISQRDGKPVALINDRLVFEGDSFDGIRVLHIGETEVEVEIKGQKRILRF